MKLDVTPISRQNAWTWLTATFPFSGYIKERRRPAYELLVSEAAHLLPHGGKILDFGAGPCDKTALFARAGFEVVAFDDLADPWHLVPENRRKILAFAAEAGIDYRTTAESALGVQEDEAFDMIMLHHVLEHLHSSPRDLLQTLLGALKPGGVLYVTVPNAVNIRKRIAVVAGRSNYPSYASFYWYPGEWRGHVREYVEGDLRQLGAFLGLENVKITSYFHFPHVLPRPAMQALKVACLAAPGCRDSWMMSGRKGADWRPRPAKVGADLAASLGRSEFYDYSTFAG